MNIAEIADHPRLQVWWPAPMIWPKNWLRPRKSRGLQLGLQSMVMAARAAGCAVIDGVYNKFKDEDGLRNARRQGAGFDGKTLIHPQIEVANQMFALTEAELDLASADRRFEEITRGRCWCGWKYR